ncbi:hypothetical protein SBV1_2790009 [Verrucomicrobia bacterium]|nr:hypothetical protein SBV1_2790009 [Verrucomicrobiota bacterium]
MSQRDGDITMAIFASYVIGQFMEGSVRQSIMRIDTTASLGLAPANGAFLANRVCRSDLPRHGAGQPGAEDLRR